MFVLYADKSRLSVRQSEPVTSGSVGVHRARFEFSPDWDGLTRTAVFRAGGVLRAVLLDGTDECAVPWEVLERPNVLLQAGVCGAAGGETVLPTVWASLGTVLTGTDVGEGVVPPTPELWEQALAGKGDTLGYNEAGELGLYAGKKLLSAVPVAGGEGGGPMWRVGHGLKVEAGALAVDAVEDFAGDNTLPMTAAGVQTAVGNIEALLGTI